MDVHILQEPNQTPVPNAGPDQTVQVPHDGDPDTNVVMVTLNGDATTDGDGDRLDYFWSCRVLPSGPVYATSTDRVTVMPLKGPISGQHVNECTLKVTDTYAATATDKVLITTKVEPNAPPVVDVGTAQTYTVPHDGDNYTNTVTVTLPGSATTDTEDYMSPDGKVKLVTKDDVLTYFWDCPTGGAMAFNGNRNTRGDPNYNGGPTASDHMGGPHHPLDMGNSAHRRAAGPLDRGNWGSRYHTAAGVNGPIDAASSIQNDAQKQPNNPYGKLPEDFGRDSHPYGGEGKKTHRSDQETSSSELPTSGTSRVTSTDAHAVVSLVAGVHTCTLTVTDTYGKNYAAGTLTGQASKSVVITVLPEPNNAPVVDVGPAQTYTVPHYGDNYTNTVTVTLPGSATTDTENYMSPDGKVKLVTKDDVLTYFWDCPTGGAMAYNGNTKGGPHHILDDGWGSRFHTTAGVDGTPEATRAQPHEHNENRDHRSDQETSSSELPTSGTSRITSTDATTVVAMVAGIHTCTLTVTDTYGKYYHNTGQASKSVVITVNPEPNNAPVIDVGLAQTYTVPHDGDRETNTVTVTLPGSATKDTEDYMSPDGKVKLVTKDDVLMYRWNCPTGGGGAYPVTSTDATTVVSMVAGVHTCTLTVTDTYGKNYKFTGQASKSVVITIHPEPNNAPIANAGPDQTYTVPHDGRTFTNTVLVTLPGALSSDVENYMSPDGKVVWERKSDRLDYQWSCPTAGVTSSDVVTIVPMIKGTHVCTLNVTDTYGKDYMFTGHHSDTTTITVNAEPNMGYTP
jgi:hypothetical protein